MPLLFAVTLFVSAALLFSVQPLIAKMILPLLGGSPGVWNTCLVFFQALLLAGYTYAHASTAWLGVRRQAVLQLGLLLLPALALPLLLLPLRLAESVTLETKVAPPVWVMEWLGPPPAEANPIPWLLALLLFSVGLPFFMLATSAPLLQKWFASTGHPAAKDPYFLYAASNLGSMLALLAYPLLLEPTLGLEQQTWVWAGGYGLLVILTASCAVTLWRSRNSDKETRRQGDKEKEERVTSGSVSLSPYLPVSLSFRRRLRWVALAFVPSSLLLGVTTYLTTDIAAIPLLWIVPLALYLLTFILVFARRPWLPHAQMVAAMPLAVVVMALSTLLEPSVLWIPLHLVAFFAVAMVCHGELAKDRPPPQYLTEFYLWLSVGGVLGGLFNALIAPLVFNGVVEYPLALVLACWLRPAPAAAASGQQAVHRWLDFALPLALGLLVAGVLVVLPALHPKPDKVSFFVVLATFVVGTLLCYTFKDRPLRFALGLGALLLAAELRAGVAAPKQRVVHRQRSFFAVLRVMDNAEDNYRSFVHGNTDHGLQSLDPDRRREPLSYFHRTGPFGQLFEVYRASGARPHVAIVGLGSGSMACYAKPDQYWTFYEIDPAVAAIALDPKYFTFWQDFEGAKKTLVLGDGRLRLRDAASGEYGLIVLDAFSSDAVPPHLLTREAVRLYLDKLAPGGLLAFNISNKYLNLKPVLGNLARDADLVCLLRDDTRVSEEDEKSGKRPSLWVVMARRPADLGDLTDDPRWQLLRGEPGATVWTDSFSNILNIIKWRERFASD